MLRTFFKNLILFLLTIEARLVLKKYRPKIVAITGNAGKTGTKDAVAAVLGREFFIWKNEKSYNSDVGIPLTVLHCGNAWSNPLAWLKNVVEGLVLLLLPHDYPKWLVLEVGADKPGDIGKFANWLRPDIVVVTRIGETPVHVEFFASRDELIAEKAKLVKALKPGGTLVLNADDPDVLRMKDLASLAKVLTYGFSPGADLRASEYSISYSEGVLQLRPDGISFKLNYLGNFMTIKTPGVVGRQNVYSALAALAVGTSLNLNLLSMSAAVVGYERPPGRHLLIEGINNSTILDDTYNSSPAALELAIESAGDIKAAGRKVAVLGDMLELGHHTEEAHYKIGKIIPESFDLLVVVGQRARAFAGGALDSGMNADKIIYFDDSKTAAGEIKKMISAGDVLLVKGSQGMRMERIVEEIMANPEDKGRLLPRQEREWIEKI